MTVRELIEGLSKLDGDFPVYRGDHEWGIVEVREPPRVVDPGPHPFSLEPRPRGVVIG